MNRCLHSASQGGAITTEILDWSKETTLVLAGVASMLLHGLEGALLGLVAEFEETLNGLLAGRMLLAAYNASLVLHQVLLVKTS